MTYGTMELSCVPTTQNLWYISRKPPLRTRAFDMMEVFNVAWKLLEIRSSIYVKLNTRTKGSACIWAYVHGQHIVIKSQKRCFDDGKTLHTIALIMAWWFSLSIRVRMPIVTEVEYVKLNWLAQKKMNLTTFKLNKKNEFNHWGPFSP